MRRVWDVKRFPRNTVGARRWVAAGGVMTLLMPLALGQTVRTWEDASGDVQVRRTDAGADGQVDINLHPPADLLSYQVGAWAPSDARADIFEGAWRDAGLFMRLDLVFAGLAHPPGTMGEGEFFDPFRYGASPVFGYVEVDVDADINTGGELAFPELRYQGNAGRWGGLPSGKRLSRRVALDATAFDGDLSTPPHVECSGEEFHLAFNGRAWEDIRIKRGNANPLFQRGEAWILTGRVFHRAHGFEEFSYACCCEGGQGRYLPRVQVQFEHHESTDRTTISLVYPLTNEGSAAMRGDSEIEPFDGDACNQNSLAEAVDDLIFSTRNAPSWWRSDPDFPIIAGWEFKTVEEALTPAAWEITALTATSYVAPIPGEPWFVWTDLAPDPLPRDVDGNGAVNEADKDALVQYIAEHDGDPEYDGDGRVNGRVTVIDFGPNFSVYDVNYDGRVEASDGTPCSGRETVTGSCRRGKLKVKVTRGVSGATLTLRLDGDASTDCSTTLNNRGRGKAKFNDVAPGEHQVTLLECEAQAQATCD
ncbi:MAG: hypothetical protein FLDDKLPJ_01703 [Phycisphaerae bacterium]|nr:hypothetical protein [Phycisphaerae bacterium]